MYKCKICDHTTDSLTCYISHHSLHRNLPHAAFSCPVTTCCHVYSNYFSLKSHLRRTHLMSKLVYKKYENVHQEFVCTVFSCNQKVFCLSDYISHLKSHLESGKGTVVTCPYMGCSRNFHLRSSFSSHLSRKHRNETVVTAHASPDIATMETDLEEPEDETHLDVGATMGANEQQQFLTSIAMFYLKLQAKLLIPASTVQTIIDEFHTIHAIGHGHATAGLRVSLKNLNISDADIDQVVIDFLSNDCLRQYNTGILRSDASRKKFYKTQFCYVEPVEIYLGEDEFRKHRYCYYVPVKATLQALFQQRSVMEQYHATCRQQANGAILEDFTDGNIFRNSHFFQNHPSGIKLLLYTDTFEVVNPLGSGRKKHKIHAVYYALGNLEAYNRSNVDQIQLVLLCREVDLKKFGIQMAYETLLHDLKELEVAGISIAGTSDVKGTVFTICGDNLGSHEIGGFTTNFSTSVYFCRYCTIARNIFHDKPYITGTPLTAAIYDDALLTKRFGVIKSSIFNSLHSFHVCQPGLAPCLAHDIFEGVVAQDMAIYVQYFVRQNWFTYDQLNRAVGQFSYVGGDANDKPALLLHTGSKLSGHAAQNWCFVRLFPIIVWKWIRSCDDDVWQLVLKLREIVELVVAPRISLDQIAILKCSVSDYLHRRYCLFPERKLIPKHHYLAHYADLIIQFGPLIRLWTLRYESKHGYFKQCIRKSQNFKNVCRTASERHQLLQAYLGTSGLFPDPVNYDTALAFHSADYSTEVQNSVSCLGLTSENAVICHRLTFRGTEYRKDMYVATLHNEEGKLIFGKILLLLVKNGESREVFLVLEIQPSEWLVGLGMYCIDPERSDAKSVVCTEIKSLLDYYPLPQYKVSNMLLLPQHHSVPFLFDRQ